MNARKVSLWIALAVGLVLVVFPFATGMFDKTNGVEQLTGDFRSSFTEDSLGQTRADLDEVVAMSAQLQDETLVALPGALGMQPAEFGAYMNENFPDVTVGVAQLDEILGRFQGLVGGLETQAPNFRRADEIPTSLLPSTVVPYLFLLPGAVVLALVGLGLVGQARGSRTAGAVGLRTSAAIGAVLVVATIALSVHAKAQAVDDMTEAYAPVFTEEGASQVRTDMDVVQAMAYELQTETLPALAQALAMSEAQLWAFIQAKFPEVAVGVADLDAVLPRFQALVAAIEENQSSFNQAASIPTSQSPTTALVWWLVVPGVLLILAALPTLVFPRRRATPSEEHVRVGAEA